MSTLSIPTPPDFDFRQTVISHGWYHLAPFRWDERREALHRTELLGDAAIDLRIRAKKKRLVIESESDLAPHRAELETKLRRMFQLHLDLGPFHDLCRMRQTHAHVSEARFGRLLCGSSMFEDIVKIIATTNTTWRQTVRMNELLVERCGKQSVTGTRSFPTPRAIVDAGEGVLNECRFGYRSRYVVDLAKAIDAGAVLLDEIVAGDPSDEELIKRFRRLPGIGPYGAAHLLAMEGRHRFIAVDSEFRRFVRERHFEGRKTADRKMLSVYARWGEWKYLAYWSELWMDAQRRQGGEAPQ